MFLRISSPPKNSEELLCYYLVLLLLCFLVTLLLCFLVTLLGSLWAFFCCFVTLFETRMICLHHTSYYLFCGKMYFFE